MFSILYLVWYFALCEAFSLSLRPWNARESNQILRARSRRDLHSSILSEHIPSSYIAVDNVSPDLTFQGFHLLESKRSYLGSHHLTDVRGATVRLDFNGTSIEWLGQSGTHFGLASVHLDGEKLADVNAFNPVTIHRRSMLKLSDLPNGAHHLTVSVLGEHSPASRGDFISVDAFLIQASSNVLAQRDLADQDWTLSQHGTSGVAAMQLAIISDTEAVLIDKVEHNPLMIDGHSAWAALYNLETHEVRPLRMQSNSFCAGGSWLSNGTLLSIGGNPAVSLKSGSVALQDSNGLQSLRFLNPCSRSSCKFLEHSDRIRMASPRWYNTAVRLDDGSVMIIGGSKRGGWMNNETENNPTIEFFPPKNLHGRNGLPLPLPFLRETLKANLFPIAFMLPDSRIFIAANQDAVVLDWRSNSQLRLPKIPNGVRVTYPMSGTAVLLPLSPSNDYEAEVLICGGSAIDDSRAGFDISSQERASSQCSRIVLSELGIKRGWSVEFMPEPRVMPDAVLLPDGKVVIVNGAQTGIAGYGNVKNRVGQSNAANPALRPLLYDPLAPVGKRFSHQGMPSSTIPRLYHSVASLTPNGNIMIAGSNPNLDRSNTLYGTEYRVEWLSPPYMKRERPVFDNFPLRMLYGKSFTLHSKVVLNSRSIMVSLVDLAFVSHGVHMNSRLVHLKFEIASNGRSLIISAPPHQAIYPPGPAWVYVVVDGVPSLGKKVMIGDGSGPPVDIGAIENLLRFSDSDKTVSGKSHDEGS